MANESYHEAAIKWPHLRHHKFAQYRCDGHGTHGGQNFTSYALKFMPIFDERGWPIQLRAFLYIVCLLYILVGIKYAVDSFMAAVKYITSRKIRVKEKCIDSGKVEECEVKLWNETVATLTIGALATGSPEICLNIIELAGSKFTENELGPSTIVGSAAFNLFITTAVAMISVPSPAMRRIEHVNVYFVALAFSLITYFWLLTIIIFIPPLYEIDTYEAAILLALFPIMIICAYLAEKKPWEKHHDETPNVSRRPSQNDEPQLTCAVGSPIAALGEVAMRERHLEKPTDIAEFVAHQLDEQEPKDLAYYRTHDKVVPAEDTPESHAHTAPSTGQESSDNAKEAPESTVQFAKAEYRVREKMERISLRVTRRGNLLHSCNVHYNTVGGTATAGDDYNAKEGTLHFPHGSSAQFIDIEIIENKNPEADEIFYVQLQCDDGTCTVGRPGEARVRILGDVVGTLIEFETLHEIVVESQKVVTVVVARKGIITGRSEVIYKTRDGSALAQVDYKETSGMIVFEPNQVEAPIRIQLIQTGQQKKHVQFFVRLHDSAFKGWVAKDDTTAVQLGALAVHTVTIVGSEEQAKILHQVEELMQEKRFNDLNWREAWRKQFVYFFNVNNGDVKHASALDYVEHAIGFVWKVLFAIVPPHQILGGWVRFLVTLGIIGVMSAFLGDVAKQIGCLCGVNQIMVGLTLVTLGTNLPDVLAARHAAINAKEADEAIGHIWGAICVNAMVGLGLPWLIGCIYFQVLYPEVHLVASSDNLVFPFAFFLSAAVLCAVILMLRRYLAFFGKGELGGTSLKKYAGAVVMVSCWVVFIGVSHILSSHRTGHKE